MQKSIFTLVLFSLFAFAANAQQARSFFEQTDAFLKKYIQNGQVAYAKIQNEQPLQPLVRQIKEADLQSFTPDEQKAFLINAYNLLVIHKASQHYPLTSVLDVPQFFDKKDQWVAGKKVSLNQLEKEWLFTDFPDARLHFVLVCGALDCPPITDVAYRPALLEKQLDQQTKNAVDDKQFIRVDPTQQFIQLSKIFDWYQKDFGGSQEMVLTFINKYRTTPLPSSYKVSYYAYDWSLNQMVSTSTEIENNEARYVVSAAIAKGTIETKWFNNLYTQQTGNGENLTDRSTFFTSSLSFLYGVSNRFNAGFDLRYRRVRNERLPNSAFHVFGDGDDGQSRQGVTSIGPKIRWAPIEALPNFSVQSAFWIPVGEDLEGNDQQPYIDWDGATWVTQVFNDFSIGSEFSLFTEIDFWLEDIGDENDLNRFSTPATVIFSYFPNPKTTLYALSNFSPFWQEDFDYFAQAGFGAKYQFTPNFELELLYTAFTNEFLQQNNGRASTLNLGIRINR